MEFFRLFSERNSQDQQIDVYNYEELPQRLRIQIVHILQGMFNRVSYSEQIWAILAHRIKVEFGRLELDGYSNEKSIEEFLIHEGDIETIDAIDLIFYEIDGFIESVSPPSNEEDRQLRNKMNEGIKELNYRFKQHHIGYEFIDGQLIKIDNQLVHQEIIKPAIQLLFDEGFETASNEFLQAHEHYRKGEYEEAITDAERAFESTMKIICHKKGYEYSETAPASRLINTLVTNNFLPSYLQNHFSNLWNTLSCGLPTVRNRNGSHGQGVQEIETPDYLVNFAINLAASNIVFLVNNYKNSLSS
ncbi:STM4504/CBY_0614 family protein [Priestia megaterium]|uniref:STM4504/CBY_0614 family protein n=1 Tax=Priestia megaterium TaxID=1404 RepID=UPI002FFE87C1